MKFVGGEGVNRQSSQRRSAERLKFVGREGRGGEGGQSMVNLERICKDFGRITSENVDPGGWSIDGQLEKDP